MKKVFFLSCMVILLAACGDTTDDSISTDITESGTEGKISDSNISKSETKEKIEKKSLEAHRSLESFQLAFGAEGITTDASEKPYFEMIDAKDGIIFYNGNNVVKIYEFTSTEALKAAKEKNEFMKDWPENERFVLESSDGKAIDIFNNVK